MRHSPLDKGQVLETALSLYRACVRRFIRHAPANRCRHRYEDDLGRSFVVHAFPSQLRLNWSKDTEGGIKYLDTPAPADYYVIAGQEKGQIQTWVVPMDDLVHIVGDAWGRYEKETARTYEEVTFILKEPGRRRLKVNSDALYIGGKLEPYRLMVADFQNAAEEIAVSGTAQGA
jgi:hypothetical protein